MSAHPAPALAPSRSETSRPPALAGLRVALAHDWLTGRRGGERVLERLCALFPGAPIYTLVHRPGSTSTAIESHPIVTSPLQRLPGADRSWRRLLPLMPLAVEALRPEGVDLVLSSSHCAVKALRAPKGARHLSYVHTPMRYVWDQAEAYFGPGRASSPVRALAALGAPALRRWDAWSTRRADRLVANSACVRDRIRRAWGRESVVVHPPVELDRFVATPSPGDRGFYLVVAAFAPYKRIDVALRAFRRLGRRLVVVGDGQEAERLRPLFGPGVEWIRSASDEEVAGLYRGCRAFVMPGEEDFGITPLEAQASGRPVIALGRGGATETVRPLGEPEPTGLFYPGAADPGPDDVDRLCEALLAFERAEDRFRPEACRAQAERFSPERFDRELCAEIVATLAEPSSSG